jgi:hypothetical protein
MDEKKLIAGLMNCVRELPPHADVIALRQFSLDELRTRARRLLSLVGEKDRRSLDRGDWVERDDYTLVHLTGGSRAQIFHASGAMAYFSGLPPLEARFERVEAKDRSTSLVEEAGRRLSLSEWAGHNEHIAFERLWQIKARGGDRTGALSEPVLCRLVGAYRQFVGGIPVLGAASIAVKLAGNGAVDALTLQLRSSTAEVLETTKLLDPERAARNISLQLTSLLGQTKAQLPSDAVESQYLHFGYLNLGKRKAQRLLAPAYVAQVVLRHEHERQAYVLTTAATEKAYMPLCSYGREALPSKARSAA